MHCRQIKKSDYVDRVRIALFFSRFNKKSLYLCGVLRYNNVVNESSECDYRVNRDYCPEDSAFRNTFFKKGVMEHKRLARDGQQPDSEEQGENVMNNSQRRDNGRVYIADGEVQEEMRKARMLTQKLNTVDRTDLPAIAEITKELLGKSDGAFINPPFYCDYGYHIEVGRNFFANYNCTILDVAKVTIGDNCLMAPNVSIYTAGHPIYPDTRNSGYEYGIEVTIGDNVWIGGSTVICPGVHIGSNVVIGAGSVVTKDIPDWVVAAGNPCRVIRPITEADQRLYWKTQRIDDEAWEKIKK